VAIARAFRLASVVGSSVEAGVAGRAAADMALSGGKGNPGSVLHRSNHYKPN
jgi:hypothetical protein